MISDEVLSEFFKTAREAVERLDRTVGAAMRGAHRDHGLYSELAHGAVSVAEAGLVFSVFMALMDQQYFMKHRIEVRHEYPYPGLASTGWRMDLAMLEPRTEGPPTLGACIETKWWHTLAPVKSDVAKMRDLPLGARTLMLLAWGQRDPNVLADWVEPQARDVGLTVRPAWCFGFPASVYIGTTKQEGGLWVALMEAARTLPERPGSVGAVWPT